MNTTSKMIIGIAAGVTAGAILGILFAPEKGSELRKRIAERSRKIAEEVKEKFEAKANDWKEKVKDLA